MARLRREVEQGIQREIERQLRGLCAGGLLVPGLLLGASMWLRQWGSGHRRDP